MSIVLGVACQLILSVLTLRTKRNWIILSAVILFIIDLTLHIAIYGYSFIYIKVGISSVTCKWVENYIHSEVSKLVRKLSIIVRKSVKDINPQI